MLNVTITVRTRVTLKEAKVAFSIPKTNTSVFEVRKEVAICVWQNLEVRHPAVCEYYT